MDENLSKKFDLMATISLSFGIVVGIGIYFKTGEIATLSQGNLVIGLLAWAFAGVLTILCGLTYAEYAGATQETGGSITYLRNAAGNLPAFMMGWGKVLLSEPALIVVIAWVAAEFTMGIVGLEGNACHVAITFVIITTLFAINTFKPKLGGQGQTVMTIIKMLPLICIIVGGLTFSGGNLGTSLSQPIVLQEGSSVVSVFLATLIPVVFAFAGWDYAATVSAEVKDAKKNVPKAIISSIILVTIFYVLIYLAFANVLPIDKLATDVPFGAVITVFGESMGTVLMCCIVISAIGAANGIIIGSSRNPYSLAIKNLFIKNEYFAKIDEKYDVPLRSIGLSYIFALAHLTLFAFLGTAGDFSGICIVFNMLLNCIIYGGLVVMRYQKKLPEDGFRTKCFPLVPVLATATTFMLCIGLFFVDAATTRNVLLAIVFYAIGLPVYYFTHKKKEK